MQKREPLQSDSLVKNWRRPTFPQTSAVSSAMKGLTSLFGMGRGEHLLYNHQNIVLCGGLKVSRVLKDFKVSKVCRSQLTIGQQDT